jgi:aconitase A
VQALAAHSIDADGYRRRYADAFDGDARGQALPVRGGARFTLTARLDTRREVAYWRHGGMLPFVLRAMLDQSN